MDKPPGMLGEEDLERSVASGDVDTVVVAFTDHYGRLHGKRFDANHFVEEAIDHGTHACDYLLTVDMEMEPMPGISIRVGSSGLETSTWSRISAL